ncbi:hypothetical protein OTU49_001464 [Cherax quadricarinatus]
MGRYRVCSGTYSRAPKPPKTEEEKRARYKQRVVVPKFDDLFIEKNENARAENSSEDSINALVKGVKSLALSEDTLLNSSTVRKPLAVNSLLANSTLGASRISADNTFDKLVGDVRVTQISQIVNCPSSSVSSLELSGVLFKSLSANPAKDSSFSTGKGLQPVPEVENYEGRKKDIQHCDITHRLFKVKPPVSYIKKNSKLSPVFSSDNKPVNIVENNNVQHCDSAGHITHTDELLVPHTECKVIASPELFSSHNETSGIVNNEKEVGHFTHKNDAEKTSESVSSKSLQLFSSYYESNPVDYQNVAGNITQKNHLSVISTKTKVMTSQVLSTGDDSCVTVHNENAAGQPVSSKMLHERKELTSLVGDRKRGRAVRRTARKIDVIDKSSFPSNARCKDTMKANVLLDLDENNDLRNKVTLNTNHRLKIPIIKLYRISDRPEPTLTVEKNFNSVNKLSPVQSRVTDSCLHSSSEQSDNLKTRCVFSLDPKITNRKSENSPGSQRSGKSSICTSTPADANKHKTVFSFNASPSNDNVLSPVPWENYAISIDSSVFESPMIHKEKSAALSNVTGGSSSLGSRYETCVTSNKCGLNVDASFKMEKNCESVKGINGCSEIMNGPEGAFVPVYNFKSSLQTELTSSQIQVTRDKEVSKTSTTMERSQDNFTDISLKLGNLKRRKRNMTKRPQVRRLKSPVDLSAGGESVILVAEREEDTVSINLMLSSRKRNKSERVAQQLKFDHSSTCSGHAVTSTSETGNISSRSAEVEQSIILTRKSRVALGKENRPLVEQRSSFCRSRKSERIQKRKHKNFYTAAQNQESDNEHSSYLSRSRLKCNTINISDTEQSPILTRKRRSCRLLKCENTIPLTIATNEQCSQFLSVNTKLERLPLREYNTGHRNVRKEKVSNVMNTSKLLAKMTKVGCSSCRIGRASFGSTSKNSFISVFKKGRKRKRNNLIYYKASCSREISKPSISSEECSSGKESDCEILASSRDEPSTQGELSIEAGTMEPKFGSVEASERRIDGASVIKLESPNNLAEFKEASIESRECNCMSRGVEAGQEFNNAGNKSSKSMKSVHSISSLTSTHELNGHGFMPALGEMLKMSGTRWKRPFRSTAIPKIFHSAVGQCDDIRRQTLHCILKENRKISGLRMSSIPLETSCGINNLEVHPWEEVHNRSKSRLQITFNNEDDRNQANLIPSDPREHVLLLCEQEEPLPLTDCFTERCLCCCKKIGEGVYGEVFMTQPNPSSLEGAAVLKVMPIEGNFDVNGEPQKTFKEILSEIIISLELSNLRKADKEENWCENFVHLLKCWCVQGRYHQDMLHLWDLYHEKKGSENDRPDRFLDSQLYIVLEFGHGGCDLESYIFNNARDALAIFYQIAYSLAVAEEELEFEHRDLHWGNVLVAQTPEASISFKLRGESYTLQTHGLKATVIDFTLSRMKLPNCIVYNNLADDPSLFTAEGDYQFDVYRQMRESNKNEWEKYTPYTNVLWLHYILDKMVSGCYFKNVKTKVHKTHYAQLKKLKQQMLNYKTAAEFLIMRELDV